ncbi:sensor histidine kinase [Phenylobacterium sp.]|uniref:sensor histidine kinase n=1 Tax=Phenylobacterium sp. TaxID=1871053 RepID=UPI00301C53F3
MASPSDDEANALERHTARQRESEHRVKNTLQLISSIVMLQGRRVSDDDVRQALKAVQSRVAAVSVAHRHVAWSEDAEEAELAALVREIVGDLAGSAGREGVDIDLDLESVTIPGRNAAPMALIVSEAVGNALRHAYPDGRNGRIRVALRRIGEGFELSVADDGVGVDDGTGDRAPTPAFGLTVAQLMAQQVRGRLQTGGVPGQPGVRIAVTVTMDSTAPRA